MRARRRVQVAAQPIVTAPLCVSGSLDGVADEAQRSRILWRERAVRRAVDPAALGMVSALAWNLAPASSALLDPDRPHRH